MATYGGGSCFLQGTQILTSGGYIQIEKLHIGDLVKTVDYGYKEICLIGRKTIINNTNETNCIYKYSSSDNPELIEDLFITGCHSVLVKELPYNHYVVRSYGQKKYIIDTEKKNKINQFYKLAVYNDKTAVKTVYTKPVTVFSIALGDSASDNVSYGIYANGLLVESVPFGHLMNSNMSLTYNQ